MFSLERDWPRKRRVGEKERRMQEEKPREEQAQG
jgi:hypothetical protein